jgi:hypothetical protein
MVEVEDNLDDIVQGAIDSVKEELLSFLNDNPDTDTCPDISNDLDYSGAIHEIIDGAVPIYTSEINDLFYLYGDELEQAFDDAGIGEKDDKGWPMGWKAAAIYCYIEQKVHEWYHENAEEVFDEWKEGRPKEEEDEEAEEAEEKPEAEPPPEGAAPAPKAPKAEEAPPPSESVQAEAKRMVDKLLEG